MKLIRVILLAMILCLLAIPPAKSQLRHELPCRSDLLVESEKIAAGEMGKTEKNNIAPHVRMYNKIVGTSPQSPYCASGQYYCYYAAAQKLGLAAGEIPIPKTALAYNVYLEGKKRGVRTGYAARIHDFINWKVVGKINGHIERVKSVLQGGWVETYAFNTSGNSGDPREGDYNAVKRRNIYHPLHRMQILGLTGFKAK